MADEFKPGVGQQVSKTVAQEWIARYERERMSDTKSVFFGRNALLAILSRDGCSGISFMFARKYDDFQKKDIDDLVMVGTTEDGRLMWTEAEPKIEDIGSNTYDQSRPCPPYCPQ
jgi:hypothetical protein